MKNLNRKTDKTPFVQLKLFFFSTNLLVTDKFSWTTTIHPGIFHGQALWADIVSLRMNTIASHDQLKQIRIGENLVVNYNG